MNKCIHCEGTGKAACKTCNGEGKVTCSTCGGSGREMSICPTCTKGKVADPRSFDDEPTLVCPDCHGKWQRDVGPCKACNGTGKVTCATCEGQGRRTCYFCHGTGSVDIEAMCRSLLDVAEECDIVHDDYHHDLNVNKNHITHEMAVAIYDAANRGVGIASYVAAALCYDFPECAGDRDFWDYLKSAADAGEGIAQFMYTTANDEEWGGDEEDWAYLKKSAEQGFVPALEVLAAIYYTDESNGRKRDLQKALECWKKIILLKDNEAWNEKTIKMAELHVKYLPDIIKGDPRAMLELGKSLLGVQPKMRGQECGPQTYVSIWYEGWWWLEKAEVAIGLGDMSALREIAQIHWDAEYCRLDGGKTHANALYKKMADAGDVVAQSILGEHLRLGKGIEKDACKAFVYLYQAAEKGDIVALRHLAHLYRDGEYAEKSRGKANELYVRAAKAGDSWSLYEIGKCYLNGTEVRKDEGEAKRLLKLATEKGEAKAKDALASISDSVTVKDKGPSGITVGKVDKGSLPKFATADYKNAVSGKPSEKSPVKKSKSTSTSPKKRWKFVVLGILFGFFGIHLAYAKRWLLFLLLWAGFITGNVVSDTKTGDDKPITEIATQQVEPSGKSTKTSTNTISNIGFGVWALLWIGGTLFIKKDGKGCRM